MNGRFLLDPPGPVDRGLGGCLARLHAAAPVALPGIQLLATLAGGLAPARDRTRRLGRPALLTVQLAYWSGLGFSGRLAARPTPAR